MSEQDVDILSRAWSVYSRGGLLYLVDKILRHNRNIISDKFHKYLSNVSEDSAIDEVCYRISCGRLKELKEQEETLSDILDTAYHYRGLGRYRKITPLQVRDEFRTLLEKVSDREPATILEIGTANGGTFYGWCRYTETVSLLISVDLPGGGFGGGYSQSHTSFFSIFAKNIQTEFFRMNSHSEETVSKIEKTLDEREIDVLFIDGDHTYEGVKEDFENYAPLVADEGIIILHDIVDHPHKPTCEVDKFWNELQQEYQTEEIIAPNAPTWGGIGILYK